MSFFIYQFLVAFIIIIAIIGNDEKERIIKRRLEKANFREIGTAMNNYSNPAINSLVIISKPNTKEKQKITNPIKVIYDFGINFINKQILELKNTLHQAGMRNNLFLKTYIRIVLLLGLLISTFIPHQIFATQEINISFKLFLCIVIILFPMGVYLSQFLILLYIKKMAVTRQEIIERGIPDLLDLMVICSEAGFDIQKIFQRTAIEIAVSNSILSDELQRTNAEFKLSLDFHKNLKNLEERTQSPKMKSITNIVIQSIEMGSSLTDGLKVLSSEIRNERALKAEEMAGKIPNKITLPLLLFLMPALFIVILGPMLLKASETFNI